MRITISLCLICPIGKKKQFRKSFLVLSTSSIIMLLGQSSSAFPLRQNAGLLTSESNLPNRKGYTSLIALDPDGPINITKANLFVSEIKRGGTDSFLNTLRTTYNVATGWTFKKGKNLKGSFNVRLQYPCGIDTDCGLGTGLKPTSKQDPRTQNLGELALQLV